MLPPWGCPPLKELHGCTPTRAHLLRKRTTEWGGGHRKERVWLASRTPHKLNFSVPPIVASIDVRGGITKPTAMAQMRGSTRKSAAQQGSYGGVSTVQVVGEIAAQGGKLWVQ